MSDDHVSHWAVATPSLDPMAAMRRERDIHRSRGDSLAREVERLRAERNAIGLSMTTGFVALDLALATAKSVQIDGMSATLALGAAGFFLCGIGRAAWCAWRDRR